MPHFDETKAYAVQEEVFFDDGREIELLHFVYAQPDIDEIRGSPERVLAAIDGFGRKKKYLMNVGEDKGKIVTDLIAEVKPKVMVQNPPPPKMPLSNPAFFELHTRWPQIIRSFPREAFRDF